MEEWKEKSVEELQKQCFHTLIWYFGAKTDYRGVAIAVGNIRDSLKTLNDNLGNIRDNLKTLNDNIQRASDSSEKLTYALNKITFWGVLVAGTGVVVAVVNLIFEIYKYNH